jgi:GNAT superfamily N-acetyltransferase
LRAEHPSQDFVAALRYLDQRGSLACGFPYEFLFSGSESGGAPFRGAFEIAGREIERLRNQVHRPRLDVIAYVTIMDGVERGLLPAKAGITRGNWQFTTLPSADAFRDAKSDIDQIRAGITSPQRVIANNLGTTADAILSETREWAIMVSKTVEDANRELVKQGYKPTVTAQDVAQVSDNPATAAQAENLLDGKPTTISDSNTKSASVEKTGAAPKPAAMADFDESKHPRADDGKFGEGGGGAKKEDAPAKKEAASPNEPAAKTGEKKDIENAKPSVSDEPTRWIEASKNFKDHPDAWNEMGKQGDFTLYHSEYYSGNKKTPADPGEGEIIAVSKDGKVVGMLHIAPHYLTPQENMEGHVEVHPDFRRQGIASAMFDAAEKATGKPALPTTSQTERLNAFWKDRLAK